MGAVEAWAALDAPWQVALDEAWISWRTGSRGTGAAVVDRRGEVVSRGRNRFAEEATEPGVLAGSNRGHEPGVVALAEAVVADGRLSSVAEGGGGAADATAVLWDDLVALSPASPPPAPR